MKDISGYKKWLNWILFTAYVIFIIWLTIFSRQPRLGARLFKPELFWSFRAWIAGESFGKRESIQNIQNVLLFIPFGVLFPGKRWKWLLITVLLFSVAIEVIQYGFNLGWCEVDDVICNVVGAVIGFGLLKWIKGNVNAA